MPTVINENDEYVLRREYMGRRHGGYSLNGQEESADYECETKQEAEQFLYNDLEAECLNNGDLSGEWTAWIQKISADTGEVIRHYEYTAIYEKELFEKPYLQSEFI